MASTAVTKWKNKAAAASKRASSVAKRTRAQKIPGALTGSALVLGGSAAAGFIGPRLPSVAGMPGEVVGGLVGIGLGAGLGGDQGAAAIMIATGMIAPWVYAQVASGQLQATVERTVGMATGTEG